MQIGSVARNISGKIQPARAMLSLSGGLDSATVLAFLLKNMDFNVHCVSFAYGSHHNTLERECAKKLFTFYDGMFPGKVTYEELDVSSIFDGVQSEFLMPDKAIPEGRYDDATMSKTVVPGRNLVFASILASRASSFDAQFVALGVHAGDHAIYKDCRIEFCKSLDTSIYLGTDVQLLTPFVTLTKGQIVSIGLQLGVPYALTRTCYTDNPIACGICGACNERREAFALNGVVDPIEYAVK